ncbi:MAG: nucleotidyltransferase domain-containing protein [Candidatus Poribacteria bacterium]
MPIVSELTPDERKRYIEALRNRPPLPEPTPEVKAERERLLVLVHKAADMLKTRFGVKRVILFGSMAEPLLFRLDSDVDIAVEGLKADDYWTAWLEMEQIIKGKSIDFIDIDDAKSPLRWAIDHYGIEI